MRWSIVPVLGSLLFACGSATPRSTAAGDEPGDVGCFQEFGKDSPGSIAGALTVESEEFTGCIGDSQGDAADAFRFEIPADDVRDALYRIEVEPSKTVDLCVTLVDPVQDQLRRECGGEAGKKIAMWVVAATGKELRLRVEPALALDRSESYSIRTSYELIDDPDEPNEYLEDAFALTFGESHEAFFVASAGGAAVELDIYRVEVAKGGSLDVSVSNVPPELSFGLELLNEEGHRIARIASKDKGGDLIGSLAIEDAGVYYLRLSNALGKFIPAKVGEGELPGYLKEKYAITATFKKGGR